MAQTQSFLTFHFTERPYFMTTMGVPPPAGAEGQGPPHCAVEYWRQTDSNSGTFERAVGMLSPIDPSVEFVFSGTLTMEEEGERQGMASFRHENGGSLCM